MTTLVWMRRDLRLSDNPALSAAIALGGPVLPVFIYSPDEEQPWVPGAASRWYLQQSLRELQASLEQQGLDLELMTGPSAAGLIKLAQQTGAGRVYWNSLYEPTILNRDQKVARELRAAGIRPEAFHDYALAAPGTITKADGNPYRVFTPFWRRLTQWLLSREHNFGLLDAPTVKNSQRVQARQKNINALGIADSHRWTQKLQAHWQAGESAATQHLARFDDRVQTYSDARNFPAVPGTSRLSAALHVGEISPWRLFWHYQNQSTNPGQEEITPQAEPFIRQLGWREFTINLLHEFPASTQTSLDPRFEDSGIWFYNEPSIKTWQEGRTGFPMVDAGMHELWETGYMHNRVRMVAASLLTKNLGQHWIHGATWFWDTLVDADLANNTMGWQWVAGCGCDAAPYFRIFNPNTQAKKFDPQGKYIARWLNSPFEDPPEIDLASTRQSALARYAQLQR